MKHGKAMFGASWQHPAGMVNTARAATVPAATARCGGAAGGPVPSRGVERRRGSFWALPYCWPLLSPPQTELNMSFSSVQPNETYEKLAQCQL